jgi:hypothetical protein
VIATFQGLYIGGGSIFATLTYCGKRKKKKREKERRV